MIDAGRDIVILHAVHATVEIGQTVLGGLAQLDAVFGLNRIVAVQLGEVINLRQDDRCRRLLLVQKLRRLRQHIGPRRAFGAADVQQHGVDLVSRSSTV